MMTHDAKQALKQAFLCPYTLYRGHVTLDALTFDAYLQKFAQRAGFIAALHTSGQLSTSEAYNQLADLWHQLSEAYVPVSPTLNCQP
ncbi:hypothetical protein MZ909_01140 [Thermosynechococcus sp. B0]|uniref:DUF7219 family protein n=1 Tax=unclassified Thermosynechococcus TaxID=2622553 RepID=UPI0025772B82|nr:MULTISPECIES: hypothetical protein [unclassified Thermosynechococcus]WJI24307.1 hypothetical protein MZ909_01140 [Thermosynechococcus sp. B0]WJI26826.1 hypothetical protein M0644_01155 [Thermosynechococcus sp. B1]WJI29358.1 hypothetical protein M0646_01175 [Thermosynechococcus sp. B3]